MVKTFFFVFFIATSSAFAEEMTCPHHADHQAKVHHQGDLVMGFDHTKTTHEFLPDASGGVIKAEAVDADDQQTIDSIRKHFQTIAKEFSEGDFSKPKQIHDVVPPGAQEMIDSRGEISYEYRELPKGGEVEIKTENPKGLEAIHSFLHFQNEEHHPEAERSESHSQR
jgi:hypothetical protein